MTSVPIPPVLFPLKTSAVEMIQPNYENHSLMDHIHRIPLHSASDNNLTSFNLRVPFKSQNLVSSFSPPSILSKRITSALDLILNKRTFSSDVFRSQNVSLTSPNLNDPNGSFSNNDLNSKQLPDLSKNTIRAEEKHSKAHTDNNKSVLGSDKDVQLNDSITNKNVESTLNETTETTTENDGSFVSKGKEYSCLICDMHFWTEDILTAHLEGNDFSCRICTAEFISHADLKVHFLSHQKFRCVVCKKVFLCKEDLFTHRQTSLTCTSIFDCDICKKSYSCKESVRKHKQSIHCADTNIYNCVVCNKKFLLPFKLKAHQNSCHVAYESIECNLCNVTTLGPDRLKFHKKSTHLQKRVVCPFTCSFCGKVLYFKKALVRHEKLHTEGKEMIVCEYCGKSCAGARKLSVHIRNYHKAFTTNKCPTCNKEYSNKKSLDGHIVRKHKQSVLTPAICDICGKTLKQKAQLKTHLLVHSGERKFKCDFCPATFKQSAALSTHSRIHSSVCKYNCEACGKSFRWKQTFNIHVTKCKATQNN